MKFLNEYQEEDPDEYIKRIKEDVLMKKEVKEWIIKNQKEVNNGEQRKSR